jgi:aspartate aminotransferase-like enzyme
MDKPSSATIASFVERRNRDRQLFTAGPASLLAENLTGLRPCFGRGDEDYLAAEALVLQSLTRMTGHAQLVRLQGSASLALEIAIRNFLSGRVLIVDTGFYSDRLKAMAQAAMAQHAEVSSIEKITAIDIAYPTGRYDWVLACATETSIGLKIPIDTLRQLADRLGAQLLLDATASIGLEGNHELADVIAYSSCKGLFGLTGAAFIASHRLPTVDVDSFYLSYANHRDKRMTGPYHAILSLADVLPQHANFREAVVINKQVFTEKMRPWIPVPENHQPLLCTRVTRKVSSANPAAVLYSSRHPIDGSIVCHLGEVHLGREARGRILDALEFPA